MPNRYRTILIAVDASDDADRVLTAATEFDPKGDERFHVVTVIPPMVDGVGGMAAGMLAANWPVQEMEAALRREITDSVRERVARFGIPPERVSVRYGRPASEIQAEAERVGADLIVVGSHARRGLARVVLGSTANGVLHGARCDVLVIRVPE
ncbi:MAG TPA: universal stress protein [Pseudomonadales bacterium]